jgi:hypothetical protein
VIGGLRVYVATVEEIARNEDEIDSSGYCIAVDDFLPRAKEIARAIRQVVSPDAEMYVGYVEESGHWWIILAVHKIW